jgi:hypothetical protein
MQALRGGRLVQQWGSFGSLDTAARVGPPLRVTPMEPPYPPSFVYSLGLHGRGGWGRGQPGLALVPSGTIAGPV